MSKLKILQERATYTFGSYFELPNDTYEVLAELGYGFARLQLPKTARRNKLEHNLYLITRDMRSYTLPNDLEELVKILVGILE